MRRALHEGQMRPLQEKATRKSWPQHARASRGPGEHVSTMTKDSTMTQMPSARPVAALRRRFGGHRLDPSRNSLNALRLVLALCVLVSHSFPLTGRSPEPSLAGESLGGWAVIGFFALSGYLITGSRLRGTFGTYLASRVARIFPAFLACLVVVAFGFAPLAFWREHGTLSGFLTTANTPANYMFQNAGLKMFDYSVASTLGANPYPYAWNGSLWSLWYEFACYIVIGLLAFVALRRSQVSPGRLTVLVALLFATTTAAHAAIGTTQQYFGGNPDVTLLAKLLPYFLGGSLVYLLRDRIPLVWPVALAGALATAGLVWWSPAWGGQLAAPCVTLVLLWLGRTVPSPAWIQRNDLSYGIYIYAFPAQQLASMWGLGGRLVVHVAVSALIATALAGVSWFALERPVLRAARSRHSARPPAGAALSSRHSDEPAGSSDNAEIPPEPLLSPSPRSKQDAGSA